MSTRAEKYIIALQAQYEGSEQVKRLQQDISALGQVEKLQKFNADLKRLAANMEEGSSAADRLQAAMEQSFDPALAARLDKAKIRVAELSAEYGRQNIKLKTYADAVARAEDALHAFNAGMAESPSAAERERLVRLSSAVAAAEERYIRYQQTVQKTSGAMAKAEGKVSALSAALADSVDPELERAWRKQTDQLQRWEKSAGKLRKNIDTLSASLADQKVDITNLAAEENRLGRATEQSARQMAVFRSIGLRSFADIEKEVAALRSAWNSLDKSQMSLAERFAGWDRMHQKIGRLREQTNGWTSQVQKLQQGWAGVLGVIGGLSLGKRALDEFAGFDDAMLRVQALSKATGDEFAALRQLAQDLGATTRFTATEAARGMSELASTGMNAAEIFATLPGAMDMAAISGMGVKEAADRMTDIMSQFGLQTEQAVHVVDVLTQGYTGASTSMTELGEAMTYVGPVSASLGYSLEETTAVLQALAESGYKGQRAGTALRGGLSRLLKPSAEAAAVLSRYNIEIIDSTGSMRGFADILQDLGQASLSSTEMITLFGQEAGPGMMALLNQGADAIRGYQKKLQSVDGLAAAAAARMESGIGGSLRRLGAAITSIAIAFGDTFAPVISRLADLLASVATRISSLSPLIQIVVGSVGAAVAAFASWKLGLSLVASAMGRFGLDLIGYAGRIWGLATRLLPALNTSLLTTAGSTRTFGTAMQLAEWRVGGLSGRINLLAARLPLIGKLLTTNAGDFFRLSTAASTSAAALRLVGGAFSLLAAWQIGQMVGEWLNQFALVRKMGLALTQMFVMLGLRARQAWAWITGGDTAAVAKEIELAQQTFDQMYQKIDQGADLQVAENSSAQEAITAKVREEAQKQVELAEQAAAAMSDAYASVGTEKRPEKKDLFGFTDAENREVQRQYDLLDKARKHRVPRYETRVKSVDGRVPSAAEAAQLLAELAREKADTLARQAGEKLPAPELSAAKEEQAARDKTVEIKLGGARLYGSEEAVSSFIDQLEEAALLA